MRFLLALFLAIIHTPVLLAQYAPLPPRLTSARTAFLVNDGVWSKTYDKFYKEFTKWNRFEFVATKDEADIVIVLSHRVGSTGGIYTSTTITGTSARTIQVPINSSTYYIGVMDAADGELLWSDSKGESFLMSNSAKGLVSTLRKRFKGIGYTPPLEKTKRKVAPATPQESSFKEDGNMLLKYCGLAIRDIDGEKLTDSQRSNGMYCLGFISGFMDAHQWVVGLSESGPIYCIPRDSIRLGQSVRIVIKWLKNNPEKLHESAGAAVLKSLVQAFPCKP